MLYNRGYSVSDKTLLRSAKSLSGFPNLLRINDARAGIRAITAKSKYNKKLFAKPAFDDNDNPSTTLKYKLPIAIAPVRDRVKADIASASKKRPPQLTPAAKEIAKANAPKATVHT